MRVLAFLLVVAIGQVAAPAWAGALDAARQAGVLRVGTPGDYAPFSVRADDGSLSGADVTEAERVARQLGLRLQWVPTSWGKLADDTQANRFDLAVGGISVTPARKQFALFSTVLVSDGKRPVVRCADKDRFISIGSIDQPGVRVVTNPGGSNEAFARANLSAATLTVFPDNKTVAAEIVAGRQDVMVTDGVEVDHDALVHPELCAAAVPAPFTHFENAFLLQPDPALQAAVDSVLQADIASGTWARTLAEAERQP